MSSNYIYLKPVKRSPRKPTIITKKNVDDEAISKFFQDLEGDVHFDLETTGLQWWLADSPEQITSIGVAYDKEVFAMDTRSWDNEVWGYVLTRLSECNLYAFNAAFDIGWLYRQAHDIGYDGNNIIRALKGCSATLYRGLANEGYAGQRSNLGVVQEEFLKWDNVNKDWLKQALEKHKLPKARMAELAELEPYDFLYYCAIDAEASKQAWEELTKQLHEKEGELKLKFFECEELLQIKELIMQQWNGMRVNREGLAVYAAELEQRTADLVNQFRNHPQTKPLIDQWEQENCQPTVTTETIEKKIIARKGDIVGNDDISMWTKDAERTNLKKWEHEHGAWCRWDTITKEKTIKPKYKQFNINSNQQLVWLFYENLYNYEIVQGSWRDSVNLNVDGRTINLDLTAKGGLPVGKEVYPALGEPGQLLAQYNKLEKELGYVNKAIEVSSNDSRIHPGFVAYGTKTGRLAASGGFNCYSEDTEVLTKSGWKLIKDVDIKVDKVWQSDAYGNGSWCTPIRSYETEASEWYSIGSQRGRRNLLVTSDHKMLWHTYRGEFLADTLAKEGIPGGQSRAWMPTTTCGTPYKVKDYTDLEIRQAIALQADGSRRIERPDVYTLGLKKSRKISRACELFGDEFNIYNNVATWTYIKYNSTLLDGTKFKRLNLKHVSIDKADLIYEELRHWDGTSRNTKRRSLEYYTTDKHNAEELQIYFSRSNYYTASLHQNKNKSYRLHVVANQQCSIKTEDIVKVNKKALAYCLEVPNGFLLVRRNGYTMVSGNCQQQPKSEPYLSCFIPDDGYVFVDVDITSLEPTVQAEFSGDKTLIDIYASGKSHDLYLWWARYIHPSAQVRQALQAEYIPEPEAIAALKVKWKKERSFIKAPVLGFSYGMGPRKLLKSLTIQGYDVTFEDCKLTFDNYWAKLKGVKEWEKELLLEWEYRGGWIKNGFGHPISLPENYKKDIVNKFTQNTGHCVLQILNKHVVDLIEESGIEEIPIIQDFHDERISMCREDDAPKLVEIFNAAFDRLNEELNPNIPFKGVPEIGQSIWDFKK